MITPADIIAYAGQFADLALNKIQLNINDAMLSVPAKKWGVKYDFAVRLLTCHLLTMAILAEKAAQKGALGALTSETTGGLSRGYSDGGGQANSNNGDSLNQTFYGKEFLRIQRSLVKTPIVVV